MVRLYVPNAGDIIWMNFSPHAGREQGGHRPALVLSPASYNAKTGLGVFCPISSKTSIYPFEVALPKNAKVQGSILSDHVRNLDWRARGATPGGTVSPEVLQQVRENITTLLQL